MTRRYIQETTVLLELSRQLGDGATVVFDSQRDVVDLGLLLLALQVPLALLDVVFEFLLAHVSRAHHVADALERVVLTEDLKDSLLQVAASAVVVWDLGVHL